MRKLSRQIFQTSEDGKFLSSLESLEVLLAKFLSILMIGVCFFTVYDLCFFLGKSFIVESLTAPLKAKDSLFEVFGLFLNVLIALELLENITVYLKEHSVRYELVVVTSLIAVARKIIIFDIEKKNAIDLMALAVAVLTLSISYLIIRWSKPSKKSDRSKKLD